MAVTTPRPLRPGPASASGAAAATATADLRDARFQAFALLRTAFTVAPIAMGLDRFFNVPVDWPTYLAPWINDAVPGSGQDFMYVVGAIEILAGVLVALKPRYGAYVVAGGDHRQPADVLGLLRHRAARSRVDARRLEPGPPGRRLRRSEALTATSGAAATVAAPPPRPGRTSDAHIRKSSCRSCGDDVRNERSTTRTT